MSEAIAGPPARARSAWPAIVWAAPVLRGLDARARADLEAAGELCEARVGERVFAPGEPADALYVVVTGAFALSAIRRGDREATSLRRIEPGGTFGEHAMLRSGGAWPAEATCAKAGTFARLPSHILRRVAERAGGATILERMMRVVRRAATYDALRGAGFERELAAAELAAVLDASAHRELARGEVLYRAGDDPTHAYVVGEGMIQLQRDELGRLHVQAYLTRGDLVGASEALSGAPRELGAAASGATWLVAVPRAQFARMARSAPRAMDALARIAGARRDAERALAMRANTTQHVLKDLYRVTVARSLLVIDQDHCVRCGHCSWSCASVHDDGVSRLLRRGDKAVAPAADGAVGGARSLLLPNSCQHCQSPACMIDCPTGAIGRDPGGEVFIREDLCIGCASCAKGCPWDNIQMAPRQAAGIFAGLLSVARPRAQTAGADEPRDQTADVAVKCDLCAGRGGGPACVAACPTAAIARVHPSDLVPEIVAPPGRRAPGSAPTLLERPPSAVPWIAAAALTSVAIAAWATSRTSTGTLSGFLTLALAAYAIPKRLRHGRSAGREALGTPGRPFGWRARALFIAHVSAGLVTLGAVLAHAGLRAPANAAGALVVAFWVTASAGLAGALAYRWVPARLSRVERGGLLPEDLPARRAEIDGRTFAALTGRSELVKSLYAHVLRPYACAPLGAVALLASGRALRQEEERLEARVQRTLAGRGEGKLLGLPELVRLSVERRALGAQRVLSAALRVWHPIHVAGTALVLVLLVLHVLVELVYR